MTVLLEHFNFAIAFFFILYFLKVIGTSNGLCVHRLPTSKSYFTVRISPFVSYFIINNLQAQSDVLNFTNYMFTIWFCLSYVIQVVNAVPENSFCGVSFSRFVFGIFDSKSSNLNFNQIYLNFKSWISMYLGLKFFRVLSQTNHSMCS